MANNRQISARFDSSKQTITLEAMGECSFSGKALKKGDTFEVSRSEAKRLMRSNAQLFRVAMV